VTLSHAGMLRQVDDVLALRQEKTVGGACDGDAEVVLQIAEVSHGELRMLTSGDALEKNR